MEPGKIEVGKDFAGLAIEAGRYMAKVEGIRFSSEGEYSRQLRLLCETISPQSEPYRNQWLAIKKGNFNDWSIDRAFNDFEGFVPSLLSVDLRKMGQRDRIKWGVNPIVKETEAHPVDVMYRLNNLSNRRTAFFDLNKVRALDGDAEMLEGYSHIEKLIQEMRWVLIDRECETLKVRPISQMMHSISGDPQLIHVFTSTCADYPDAMDKAWVRLGFSDGMGSKADVFQSLIESKAVDAKKSLLLRLIWTLQRKDRRVSINKNYSLVERGKEICMEYTASHSHEI